jgi:ABC-type transport system substrate-binding protein
MRVRLTAIVVGLTLLVAACGGSTSEDGAGDSGATGTTSVDVTVAPSGDPKPGGRGIMGLEAENSGFDATNDRWAISGIMQAQTLYDPLSAYDADGQIRPYLAQAFEPSADFRTWTIVLRPGIRFTNGEVLDAKAVADFLSAIAASTLTGGALKNMASAEPDPADPLKVIVRMKAPWAQFPTVLVGQAGMVPAPEQLAAAKAGDKEKASRRPIGTGPFVLQEWIPDNRFVATRNPDYWRTDERGNRLPYLDAVEFRPIIEVDARVAALKAGDITMMHTSSQRAIRQLRQEAAQGRIQIVEDRGENEETFIMLNTSKPPFDNVLARRAVAYATDTGPYFAVTQGDPSLATDSAFGKDSPYYFDSDFPTYDPEKAAELVRQYEAETGQPLAFELGTTPVTENEQIVTLFAEQYKAVGMDVTVKTTEQGQYIVDAATGNYQANLWRQFGAPDPDGDYVWWNKENASGPLTLNFARFANDELTAALDTARASADPEVRKEAYATVQRIWADQVPYVWLNTTTWMIGAANDVRNIGNVTLPDGQPSLPFQSGSFRLTQTWIDA